MKKYIVSITLGLLVMSGFTSCLHHRNNISVTVTEDDDEFEMEAGYRERQTKTVQVYLNERLLKNSGTYIRNGYISDEVNLDDNARFHIISSPGELSIQFNKNENSAASYEKLKQVCAGLEQILSDN
jgi:hypothetical protein